MLHALARFFGRTQGCCCVRAVRFSEAMATGSSCEDAVQQCRRNARQDGLFHTDSNRCVRTWIACEIVRFDVRSCQVVQVVGLHHGVICLPVACCASETQKRLRWRSAPSVMRSEPTVAAALLASLSREGERTGFRVPRPERCPP